MIQGQLVKLGIPCAQIHSTVYEWWRFNITRDTSDTWKLCNHWVHIMVPQLAHLILQFAQASSPEKTHHVFPSSEILGKTPVEKPAKLWASLFTSIHQHSLQSEESLC